MNAPGGPANGHILEPSKHSRTWSLSQLRQQQFDVLVIGGGIAGASAVWDASLRGLRAALIERSDFGSGTSAHSLRVLHGGIRYLQHLDLTRLHESCEERGAFLRIAPHLTRPMPFALPTYGHGLRGKLPLRAAFAMLDVLTAGRNSKTALRSQHIPSAYCMSRREFLDRFPDFDDPSLTGAGVFYDGQICNPPRVVYSVVRAAQEAGAVALNYCAAEKLLVEGGEVKGVAARDMLTGETLDVRSRVVINLTGPFAPTLNASMFEGQWLNVPLSRDMAFVLRRKLLPDMALGIQTRYRDPDAWLSRGNRHIFIVPWRQYTLVGVNSRVYTENPFELKVTREEIEGFVDEIREACPAWNVTAEDVAVVNAGLLPIGEGKQQGKKGLSLGKRSPLLDHGAAGGPRGLITAMSVRWTMGRLVAEHAVDLACQKLGAQTRVCATATTPVHGGDFSDKNALLFSLKSQAGDKIPVSALTHLADTFGSHAADVLRDGSSMLPNGETLEAEVTYSARNEMVATLADIVLRRLDLGTGAQLDDATLAACARLAGAELGWDTARQSAEINRVRSSYPFASPASQLA